MPVTARPRSRREILDTSIDRQLQSAAFATPFVMNRDNPEVVDQGRETAVDSSGVGADKESLIHRLASVERAYGELLQRVRQYERERAEIKHRLVGIMDRLDAASAVDAPRVGVLSE